MPTASADGATDNEFLMFDFDALSHGITGQTALCVAGGEVKLFWPGSDKTSPVDHARGGRV